MSRLLAARHASVEGRKRAISSMRVDKASGAPSQIYVSLEYIPWKHPIQRARYKQALIEHIISQGNNCRVFIETPNHPNPRKGARKEIQWRLS